MKKPKQYANLTDEGFKDIRAQQYARTALVLYECRTCHTRKPGSEFFPNLYCRNGRSLTRCKSCQATYAKARRHLTRKRLATHRDKKRKLYHDNRAALFSCATCHEIKRGHEFPFSETHANGVCTSRCIDCRRQYMRDYRERQRKILELATDLELNTSPPTPDDP